jgi:hypothetical protein
MLRGYWMQTWEMWLATAMLLIMITCLVCLVFTY